MTSVLVTGADGQLGRCIQDIQHHYASFNFLFVNKKELDITNPENVIDYFATHRINWCINCAAYTAVDQAEIDPKSAYDVNTLGAKNIAQACKEYDVQMIHISTDFVFDGLKQTPYTEEDRANPANVYGTSKLKGENEIKQCLDKYFIIRTSWLYSEHGNNFMKTMLRLAEVKEELNVVSDQLGSPTYAGDLAYVILEIVKLKSQKHEVYHFSNKGVTSWHEFAQTIFEESKININTLPIASKDYPTLAKRPKYSVLDTSKINKVFNLEDVDWKQSLQKALFNLREKNFR